MMDTKVSITVYARDAESADSAIEAGFAEITRLSQTFNIHDGDSEAARLNREGSIENPSPQLRRLVESSLQYSNLTGGAFDVSVQPVLDLYSRSFGELGRPPTQQEIEGALSLVGYEKIVLDASAIHLAEGMKLTFGANAKGLILDSAAEKIRGMGVKHALIDAGGDIKAVSGRPDGPWRIGLRNPENKTQSVLTIKLSDGAVTTSGDYERYFIEKEAHHILDPKTGKSTHGVMSATVTAPTALQADSLSTSIMVLGVEDGLELVEELPNVEAAIIDEDKMIHKTSGWA